jgi:DNA-binding GntR family transcriptional regulator
MKQSTFVPRRSQVTSRRSTTADEVHAIMLAAIVNGELFAGQELRDHSWATQFAVSRTPVREAIKRLEGHGIVDIAAARYTRIASFTPAKARQEAHDWASIHLALVGTLCASADRALISRLKTASDRHRSATDARRSAANFAYFAVLRAATQSFSIQLGATAVAYRLQLALPQLPELRDADLALHADIISALRLRDSGPLASAFATWTRGAFHS